MPTYKYPRPALTVDVVVFAVQLTGDQKGLRVLLIRRKHPPFKGKLAIPGGFLNLAESLDVAAFRELLEETGIKPAYIEQLYTFGATKRDPRERIVTVAYLTLVKSEEHVIRAGSDAKEADWYRVLPYNHHVLPFKIESKNSREPAFINLAFDHMEILASGVVRLRNKITYTPIAFDLLPAEFTIPQLQNLYEIVLGRQIDKGNFRRKMLATGIVKATGKTASNDSMGPKRLRLYTFDRAKYVEDEKHIDFKV
jgi:8-oxo-dGTP diphosphatase